MHVHRAAGGRTENVHYETPGTFCVQKRATRCAHGYDVVDLRFTDWNPNQPQISQRFFCPYCHQAKRTCLGMCIAS